MGLSPSTKYHYAVYEYDSCEVDHNYLITQEPMASQETAGSSRLLREGEFVTYDLDVFRTENGIGLESKVGDFKNSTIAIYDLSGKQLFKGEDVSTRSINIPLNTDSKIVIVKVKTGSQHYAQRFLLHPN